MKLFIPKDMLDNPKPPRMFLCTTDKKIIGELPSYDESLTGKWGSYSEVQFSIDRQYVDVLTGQLKTYPTFDKTEGLRKVYVENIGYFIIQDPDIIYGDKDTKILSCFSGEYETANKYLENFRVNTGEIDSKEVIALEAIHGYDYSIDKNNLYTLATVGKFDPYKKYYIKQYTSSDKYEWVQTEVKDENDYNSHFNNGLNKDTPLYIESYQSVQFYLPSEPKLSLLHLIFEKIPGWKIGHVDVKLGQKRGRKFDEDRIAVYDFLMNKVQETFKCAIEWDTLTYTVNFYEEAEDGITEDNEIQSRWETDVFVSRDNLANEININYSTDDIKTKLKVSGSDNLDIREVNLGRNYIMNLSYYHDLDWMEQDLFEAYDDYLEAIEEYNPQYSDAMQNWVGANNKYNDFMNAVPVEGNVVLVGDPFEKLYCVYKPVNTAYYKFTINNIGMIIDPDFFFLDEEYTTPIDKSNLKQGDVLIVQGFTLVCKNNINGLMFEVTEENMSTIALDTLNKKLTQYHVNEDIGANDPENILLRLKNKNSDIATIRIYNASEETSDSDKKKNPEYKIQVVLVESQSGTSKEKTYSMSEWVQGKLTSEYINWNINEDDKIDLSDYTIQYIGIMGAYFVLAKDERQEENLEEYGVNLLKEKHKIYTSIFQTQTEAMFSQEKYQCIVQDEQPDGNYDINTRWLDTNSSPAKLYQYSDKTNENGEIVGKEWKIISEKTSETDQMNYENYQRYIDNYEKMVAVQNVLIRKEKEATYMGDGFAVPEQKIDVSLYVRDEDGELRYNGQELRADMLRVAKIHFGGGVSIIYPSGSNGFEENIPICYFFAASKNMFAVYLKGTTPYVSYANSRGVWQAKMDWITKQTDFENFFTEDQWIRLSPFIREDEFSDSNFLLTGYESEEERLKICKELFEVANKELNALCQPSLEFSMNMANILALPEFKSLIDQFQLGNFVRVYIHDGYIKRSRLLEVHLNFSDLSDFSCNFGNLVTTKSEIDKHADLLAQAVTAGKQVATSASDWQKAVDKSNKLEQDIANGLADATLEIGKASGQSVIWGDFGIWGRKLVNGTTDQYDPEQFRIINNKLLFSNDGFKTSKAVFGKYTVNGEEKWGPLAEYVTADTIEGKFISGGRIEIGEGDTKFIVDENGNVSIKVGNQEKYAGQAALDEIKNAYKYTVELSYNGSTVFSSKSANTLVTAIVKDLNVDITHKLPIGTEFIWYRNGSIYKTIKITNDNKPQKDVTNKDITKLTANQINVTHEDIVGNSFFSCEVNFAETEIQKGE